MNKIKKEQLVEAMEKILLEYKEKRHDSCVKYCTLCNLYYQDFYDGSDFITVSGDHHCTNCPMFVFKTSDDLACLDRKCEPMDCRDRFKDLANKKIKIRMTKQLKAVIEFYDKALQQVWSMTEKDLNKKNAFKFLVDIDNEVGAKYNLKGRNE